MNGGGLPMESVISDWIYPGNNVVTLMGLLYTSTRAPSAKLFNPAFVAA